MVSIKEIVPQRLGAILRPPYHFSLALIAAIWYGFPSRKLVVVGVTGTKGKSSVTEMVGKIFEAAGHRTAIISTIHFVIAGKEQRNLLKMTIPGRFLLQKLLHDAVEAGCTHAVIEMSSEGAVQFRQRFVDMDALIFTHLSPEHIESHGSLERYILAKLEIGKTLARSHKRPRMIVAKKDDPVTKRFFALPVEKRISFSLEDAGPYSLGHTSSTFVYKGTTITSPLLGEFNIGNMIAAAVCTDNLGIPVSSIQRGLESLTHIPGRMEEIRMGQPFRVFVDYAHTKESLDAVYAATAAPRICVLGNTGGGRGSRKGNSIGGILNNWCRCRSRS
jgi:UDP-N-acetylmuramoyl-L-alanyl-D-glutamate--2,6-diaminopimelate ligase